MACEQKVSFLDHCSNMLAGVKIQNMGLIYPETDDNTDIV